MVDALDSRSRGLGARPSRVNVLCSLTRHFTLTALLSNQEHKWVLVNCQGSLVRSSYAPSRLMLHGNQDKVRPGVALSSSNVFFFYPGELTSLLFSFTLAYFITRHLS